MSKHFDMKKLIDVCLIRPPKKESLVSLNENDLVSFVPMKNLEVGKKHVHLNEEKELKKVYSGYTYFKDNDVLLAKITPCFENGKLGIAKNLKNGIGFGSSEYIVYRPKKLDELNSEYLYYFLSQDIIREIGTPIMTGAVGHKRIPKEFYEEYLIPIFSINEQKQIVEILDTAFEFLEKAKKNIEKNFKNTKELFDSKVNEIFSQRGKVWEEKTLGEVYDVRDGTHDSPRYYEEGYPLITSKNLKNGKLIYDKIKYISENDYQNINKRSKVDLGDILFAMIGTIGNPVVIIDEPNYAIKNVALFKINISNSSLFLKYYLDSNFVIQKMKKESKGTTQQFVGLGYLRNFPIHIPELKIQESIVKELHILESKTKQLEQKYQQKLDNIEELKKSILEKAFSGELTK